MNQRSDVVVIGAGIVGCAIAYELARRGVRVRVIDRRSVGQGATQASAGVLAPFIEAHDRGVLLDLAARSLDLYDQFVARAVEDSGAAVQYVRSGTLEVASDASGAARLDEIHATCRQHGIRSQRLDGDAVREEEPHLAPSVSAGLLVQSHGFVGASDLTAALRRAATAHGVVFRTSAEATHVRANGNRVRIETSGDAMNCETAIVAAGSWSGRVEVDGATQLPIRPVRGQLLHLGWPTPPLRRVVWAPDCYLVPWSDGSVLVGATIEEVGFDERATVAGVRSLMDATARVAPRWSRRRSWARASDCARRRRTRCRSSGVPSPCPASCTPAATSGTGFCWLRSLPPSSAISWWIRSTTPPSDVTAPSRFGDC